MKLSRTPKPALRPFVEVLWADNGSGESHSSSGRELVLPSGAMHIVFRLGDNPLRLFEDAADTTGEIVGNALIGGARDQPYLRDVSVPGPSVGALLRPGAAELMIGAPAGTLAATHTRLEEVWVPTAVAEVDGRLNEAGAEATQLDILEAALAARLPRARGIHPLIAHALARFGASCGVCEVVRDSGFSHRHFVKLFHDAVGLKPKAYCRVLRFGRALDRLTSEPQIAWAELTAAEGYADQAHFIREFRGFAGLSPGGYRQRAPAAPRHVPL